MLALFLYDNHNKKRLQFYERVASGLLYSNVIKNQVRTESAINVLSAMFRIRSKDVLQPAVKQRKTTKSFAIGGTKTPRVTSF